MSIYNISAITPKTDTIGVLVPYHTIMNKNNINYDVIIKHEKNGFARKIIAVCVDKCLYYCIIEYSLI